MTTISQAKAAIPASPYRLLGNPTAGLVMGTWGFFIGFAAVSLYGPAAKYFQEQMHLGGLALGGFIIPPFLGAVVDALGSKGYAGGFFAYVVLAVAAIGVSAYFWHLDRGAKSTKRLTPANLSVQ